MMDKLLACPFCGGMNIRIWDKSRYDTCARCDDCDSQTGWLPTISDAVAAWNSRADARQHALKTGDCPMCEDCPDGCPVETPKDSRNIIANAQQDGT